MARRWRDPSAFRADPTAAAATRPSRTQAVALLAVLTLVVGAVAAVSYLIRPDDARTFDLFRGSVFLADSVAPVAVDLATGQPTVRLADAGAQVGAKRATDLGVEPAAGGTLLFNKDTGEFTMVDTTGFLIKTDGGVPLPQRAGATGAVGIAAQDFAYIEQTGPTGTSVYLVGTTTVQSAVSTTKVKPRAFVSMPEPGDLTPGAAAAAGNDLWLLVGPEQRRTVRHLSLPPDSNPGVTLDSADEGTVSGPAAIATAGAQPDDTATGSPQGAPAVAGGSVGVASAGSISVFRGNSRVRTVPFTAPAGVDRVLAATNGTSRLSFLLHGSRGWSAVSVAADGSDRRGPTLLEGIDPDARLVPPASSEGGLYTLDAATGRIFRIDGGGTAEPLPGMAQYPIAEQDGRRIEAGGFDDAYLIARGPRVIVNSPNHLIAVAVFTDGSRAPLRIEKSAAVTVSAAGGAEALTRSRNDIPDRRPDPVKSRTAPKPVDPVNNKIDCKATSQVPHIPALGQPVPGSRSALLSWTYPVTDQNDCIPTTYRVSASVVGGDAPAAPGSVTVNGQQSLNLTGLFPSTRYEITVTAYINEKGTASAPIQITTGPEGPAAPSQVTARTDGAGNWNVSWVSCGTRRDGCVPSATWRVIPEFCDTGRGLGGLPGPVEVVADPTSVQQPGATVRGGSTLLGRALRFRVEGIGDAGQVGTPSAVTGCERSWAPPVGADLRLTASTSATVAAGQTTTASLSLGLGADPVRAVGGVGATVVFTLTGPGGAQSRTVTVDGRSATLTQSFDGVRAGANYSASARITPPGHPEAAVTRDAGSLTTRANWPTVSISPSCPPDTLLTCTLSVRISGVSSAASGNERFDLTAQSALQCGSAATPLVQNGFDPSSTTIVKSGISQLAKLYGNCTVTIELVESSGQSAPLYYGGLTSGPITAPVSLGDPAKARLAPGDFSAVWDTRGGSSAKVTYTGGKDLGALTTNWGETLHAPDDTQCGTDDSQPTPSYVPAGSCVQPYGDETTGWYVVLTYDDSTDGESHTVKVALADGAPPSYQPCTPTGFTASWGALKETGVSVSVDGQTDGCRGFGYALTAPAVDPDPAAPCGTASGAPPATILLTCGNAPSQDDWTVAITWTNPDGTDGSRTVAVSGTPPPA